jgi:hypothetical protein
MEGVVISEKRLHSSAKALSIFEEYMHSTGRRELIDVKRSLRVV